MKKDIIYLHKMMLYQSYKDYKKNKGKMISSSSYKALLRWAKKLKFEFPVQIYEGKCKPLNKNIFLKKLRRK